MTEEKKICVICGKEFIPNSPSQKICGDPECLKARRREYTRNHAEMYRELNRKHRQKPRVKKYRAAYDKQYQLNHKEQIKEYKKIWWLKKNFLEHLEKGEVLKNAYYYSLSKEEKEKLLLTLDK
jgi:hypothetical protein